MNWNEVRGKIHDASGLDNPEKYEWYKGPMGIYYPRITKKETHVSVSWGYMEFILVLEGHGIKNESIRLGLEKKGFNSGYRIKGRREVEVLRVD